MIAKGKTRITITLSYETLHELKRICNNAGCTVSEYLELEYKPVSWEEKAEIARAKWLDD